MFAAGVVAVAAGRCRPPISSSFIVAIKRHRPIDVVAANRRPALVGYLRRLTGGVIGGLWYPIGGGISAHYGELADHYLQYGDDNTLSVAGDSPFANEVGVIVDLWRSMQPLFLQEAQALEKLTFKLPIILLSNTKKRLLWNGIFCVIIRNAPYLDRLPVRWGKKIYTALAVDGTEEAGVSEHFCECLAGRVNLWDMPPNWLWPHCGVLPMSVRRRSVWWFMTVYWRGAYALWLIPPVS